MTEMPRIFPAHGVRNFRDAGGWRTRDGARVHWRRFLRSGHWADAREPDLQLFSDLDLDVLVDLRRVRERMVQPNRLPSGHSIMVVESNGGNPDEDPPHLQFLRAGNLSRESVREYMCSAYARIPTEAHNHQLFGDTVRALAAGDKVLIHCAAGKDRTGLLAALVLALLGVEEDAILEDYLLTNRAVDAHAVLPDIARQISDYLGQPVKADALFPMLGVEEDFLRTGLKQMGDVQDYARNALKLTDADISALREKMLD